MCCLFSLTCGGTTALNNTYFKVSPNTRIKHLTSRLQSTGSDSSPCVLTVCKVTPDICQLRLGFDSFVMAQPSTDYPTDGSYNGRTQCQHARFQVSSDGPSSPVLCGTNSGEHMYVEASSDCNEVSSAETEMNEEDGEQMYYLAIWDIISIFNQKSDYWETVDRLKDRRGL